MILVFIERIFGFFIRRWRRTVFKYKTGTKHNNFTLTGKVNILSSQKNIEIGQNVVIYDGVTFWGNAPIKIGNNTSIGHHTMLAAVGSKEDGISIGDNVLIAAQCYIIDSDHITNLGNCIRSMPQVSEPVKIGDDVWLGANVTVLKGSVINSGAVVGAQALVKGEVPENSISVGVKSRVIKYRGK